jgi:hypothetical protein
MSRGPWLAALAVVLSGAAIACPTDAAPRTAATLLTVQGAGPTPLALSATDLAALPATTLTQRLSVTSGQGGG